MSLGKIVGPQHAGCYIGSDGKTRIISMFSLLKMQRRKKMYENRRYLCGLIQMKWQRTLGR